MVRKSSFPSLTFPLVCLSLCQLVDWLVAPLTLTLDTLAVTHLLHCLQQYALST